MPAFAFAGRRMTALSNAEERFNPFAWKAKWFLQDELVDAGVEYDKAALPFRSHIIVDGALYTGQNPQSSIALAERILEDFAEAK